MIQNIRIADCFLTNPHKARAEASKLDFSSPFEWVDGDGESYQGLTPIKPESDLWNEVELGLSQMAGKQAVLTMAFFRLGLKDEGTPVWIHADRGCDDYASVLYLTRPAYCIGGTALFKHRGTGWESLPGPDELISEGVVANQDFINAMNRDGNDPNAWIMTGLLPAKFNRLVTYPSKMFHARWPRDCHGECFDNGRLILCGFYHFA